MHTPPPGSLLRGDLPAQRGPAEEPLVRSVQHRTFTTVRIDAQLEVQTLPAQHPEWLAHWICGTLQEPARVRVRLLHPVVFRPRAAQDVADRVVPLVAGELEQLPRRHAALRLVL